MPPRLRAGRCPGSAPGQSAGELAADVDLHVGVAQRELLEVGVDGDELDLGEAGVDHPVEGEHSDLRPPTPLPPVTA